MDVVNFLLLLAGPMDVVNLSLSLTWPHRAMQGAVLAAQHCSLEHSICFPPSHWSAVKTCHLGPAFEKRLSLEEIVLFKYCHSATTQAVQSYVAERITCGC